MRCYRNLIAMGMLLAFMGGCASPGVSQQSSAQGPHDQCIVCKHNADLACVDVAVDSKTPKYLYQGKTYYFCSDECRNEFIKNPSKYAQ